MPYFGPSFRNEVSETFEEDPEKGFYQTYLSKVLTNWRDVETRLRHTALLAIVIAAFGELLIYGHVTQLQFAGLTIKGLPIFQKVIPVVGGYLIYDFCNLIVVTSTYLSLYDALIKTMYPKMRSSKSDIATAIEPPMSLFYGERSWYLYYNDRLPIIPAAILGLIRPFLIIAAPLAYIVQQFSHLAAIDQADILFWICVALTSLLIAVSIAILISWLSGPFQIYGN